MSGNRFVRFGQLQHSDPKFGRLLAVSLALHVVLLLAFQLALSNRQAAPQKTVYYVDLTQLPVKNPRAGRPAPPAPKVKTPPPASRKPATSKAAPKATAKTPATTQPRKDTTADAIQKLRSEQARSREQQLRDKLAALTAEDTREATPATATDAPLGSVTGQGDEIGPDQKTWLYARLKELWNLSRYQVDTLDLEAIMELEFSPSGELLTYRFIEKSGSARFDDSLIRVMLKLKQEPLPFTFDRRTRIRAIFNLKDLRR